MAVNRFSGFHNNDDLKNIRTQTLDKLNATQTKIESKTILVFWNSLCMTVSCYIKLSLLRKAEPTNNKVLQCHF